MSRGNPAAGLLADLAEVEAATQVVKKCVFGALLEDRFSAEERSAFEGMLANPKVPTMKLLQVLRKNGYRIGDNTLYGHRRGLCTCYHEGAK